MPPVYKPLYVWTPPICLFAPYVWMPYVHTQHKESMLCQTKGVSICPTCLETPSVCWMAFLCLHGPLYVWMPPICLVVHCMFGYLHMFGCPLYVWVPYVWMPPVFLDNPHMSGHPPVCLDASLYVWASPMFGCLPCVDAPLYVWRCLDASCTYTTQRKHALSD